VDKQDGQKTKKISKQMLNKKINTSNRSPSINKSSKTKKNTRVKNLTLLCKSKSGILALNLII